MRTNLNTVVANRNVFGFGQDCVVVSSWKDSCAHAAQHLASRHASHRARLARLRTRGGLAGDAMAGAAPKAKRTRLAITGPQWQPVRLTSPELVTA